MLVCRQNIEHTSHYYRRVRSTTGGHVFTGVCQSTGGRLPQGLWPLICGLFLGRRDPGMYPWTGQGYPQKGQPPPPDRLCHRWYASCGHAGELSCFLVFVHFHTSSKSQFLSTAILSSLTLCNQYSMTAYR